MPRHFFPASNEIVRRDLDPASITEVGPQMFTPVAEVVRATLFLAA
jgi:hypothetical protein